MVSGVSDTLILTLAIVIFVVIYALMMQIRVQVRAFAFRVHKRALPRHLLEGLRGRRAKELYTEIMSETWELARGDDIDRSGIVGARDYRGSILRGHERAIGLSGVRVPDIDGPLAWEKALDGGLRAVLRERNLLSPEDAERYFAILNRCRYSDEKITRRDWETAQEVFGRIEAMGGKGGPGRPRSQGPGRHPSR